MTNTQALKADEYLATYFSGSNVAAASIGLEIGGHAKLMADAFFRCRKALGIEGYASRDEIIALLTRTPDAQPSSERVELVDRIKQIKAERKRYFDVEGDGVDVLLNDIWDYLDRAAQVTKP